MEVVNTWYSKQEGDLGLTDPILVLPEGPDRVPCIRWVRPHTSTYHPIRRMNECAHLVFTVKLFKPYTSDGLARTLDGRNAYIILVAINLGER